MDSSLRTSNGAKSQVFVSESILLVVGNSFFRKSFYYLIRKFPVFNCGNLFAE